MHSVAGQHGRRRPRRSCAQSFTPPAAQLHVVGQPQGPGGQERVRGRLPRSRQHRRVRPQRRRCRPAGASSRPTAPAGWRCSARTCSSWRSSSLERRPDYADFVLKFVEHFFWIAAAVDPDRRPPRRAVGRGGRLLLRRAAPSRTAPAQRLKVRSLVGLLPMCATTVISADVLERFPSCCARIARRSCDRNRDLHRQRRRPVRARASTAAACCRSSTRTSCAGSSTRMLDEERFLGAARHPLAVAWHHLDRPVRVRRRTAQTYRVAVRAGRVDDGHVRRQLELARAGVVPGQPADPPGPAAALPLLRRRRSRSSARPGRATR